MAPKPNKILLDKEDGSTGKNKFHVYEETIQLEKPLHHLQDLKE